jgi:hypothetical protein
MYLNRVRWAVLGLSKDGAGRDLFEDLTVNSLKGELSNATNFNPPLFSLANIFKLTQRILVLKMQTKIRNLLYHFDPFSPSLPLSPSNEIVELSALLSNSNLNARNLKG